LPDVLRQSFPSTAFAGSAALLDGAFDTQFKICLDSQELAVPYTDRANAMIQIPKGTPLGHHVLRLIRPDGTVSKRVNIDVTDHVDPGPTYIDDSSKPPVPVFASRSDLFVPKYVTVLEPITNSWFDAFTSAFSLFSLGGTPGTSAPSGSAHPSANATVSISGQWDIEHTRIYFTVTTASGSWQYVALQSCPPTHRVTCGSGHDDIEVDACAPDPSKFDTPGSYVSCSSFSMQHRLLFFPVAIPAPQALLQLRAPLQAGE
jgi:hypothetical protein